MWQYLDILGEKAKQFGFTRLWTGKIQVFQAPTGYSTAEKAFIAFLSDKILAFEGKKPKLKIEIGQQAMMGSDYPTKYPILQA